MYLRTSKIYFCGKEPKGIRNVSKLQTKRFTNSEGYQAHTDTGVGIGGYSIFVKLAALRRLLKTQGVCPPESPNKPVESNSYTSDSFCIFIDYL